MRPFVWKDGITVDYGDGMAFTLPETQETVDKLETVHNKMSGSIEHETDPKKVVNALLDAVDDMLGEGATTKLFAGHTLSPRNAFSVWMHIYNSVVEQYSAVSEVEAIVADAQEKQKRLNDLKIKPEARAQAVQNAQELGVLQSVPTAVKPPRL